MKEVGENFSTSGPENHGFSSLNNVFWNLNQQQIYKIILEGHSYGGLVVNNVMLKLNDLRH